METTEVTDPIEAKLALDAEVTIESLVEVTIDLCFKAFFFDFLLFGFNDLSLANDLLDFPFREDFPVFPDVDGEFNEAKVVVEPIVAGVLVVSSTRSVEVDPRLNVEHECCE